MPWLNSSKQADAQGPRPIPDPIVRSGVASRFAAWPGEYKITQNIAESGYVKNAFDKEYITNLTPNAVAQS